MINKIIKKLNEPFPDSCDFKKSLIKNIPIALFVSSFLYFFRPFGIYYTEDSFWLACLGFGAVTYVVSTIYEAFQLFVLRLKKEDSSWTLGKWLFSVLILIMLISVANYLYSFLLSGSETFRWEDLRRFIVYTISIGIFPLTVSGLITLNRNQRRNEELASKIQEKKLIIKATSDKRISLPSLNEHEELLVEADHLLYLEAMENYVAVFFKNDLEVRRKMLRNTLKAVKDSLPENDFLQCHRSFIVNLNLVQEVEGNAQGLKLGLKNFKEKKIPVSRKYISVLKERIN